jgi:hypothetical protein
MANLIIEVYHYNPQIDLEPLTKEHLVTIITIPLVVAKLLAKHMPDRMIRRIYADNGIPQNEVQFDLKALLQLVSDVLQDLGTNTDSSEPIMEVYGPDEGETHVKVIFRVE